MAIRIGIMSFAHMHAHSYATVLRERPDVDFVGIADESAERGQRVATQLEVPFFGDCGTLLAEGLDGLVVTTENAKHEEYVCQAAAAGVHVLCEKPLSTTVAAGRTMIDQCRAAGVNLQMAFPARFSAPLQAARQAMVAGRLGRIVGLVGRNRGLMPGGWFVDAELAGGGAIADHTVHLADVVRFITGAEFVEVYAEAGTLIHGELAVDDCALLSLALDNGAIMTIDASWSRPTGGFPTWGDLTLSLVGTDGVLDVDALAQDLDFYPARPAAGERIFWGASLDGGLVEEFVASIRDARPPSVDGQDGLAALEVVVAAYRSLELARPVRIAEVR